MRIGSVSGIAGRGDFSLIHPVPDAETLPLVILSSIQILRKTPIRGKFLDFLDFVFKTFLHCYCYCGSSKHQKPIRLIRFTMFSGGGFHVSLRN